MLTRALRAEFPELDPERLRTAVERAVARVASASLDTEGYRVVDLHLQRAEASEESTERAQILRDLAENLEQRGDADRALVVRLAAFGEVPQAGDIDPLLRLAKITERWSELPLDTMNAMVDIQDDAAPRRLKELAAAWQHVGRGYQGADCLERVLLIAPGDAEANEALEVFYRSAGEWPVLVDLLGRRAVHVADDKERAEVYREIAQLYDRELGDESAALDAYREADHLEPGKAEVIEAIARLAGKVGLPEDEALGAFERLADIQTDPKERARTLVKAAELAKLEDWDRAQTLFERARTDDPDYVPAVDGLVVLLRDKGQLSEAVTLLVNAADRPALKAERGRWLADAGDYCVALGDTDWAKQLYRDAREADPTNHKAGVALVELCWDSGDLVELAPILDELCRITDDPARLRGYLLQRSKVAAHLGDSTGARNALSMAVDLDPADTQARTELAEMLFDAQQWAKARPMIEGLLEHEDSLMPAVAVELHYKLARVARELGDAEAAARHVDITLALATDHRGALLLRTELNTADPLTAVADQLALINTAPPEEKATRYAAIGDRYVELGDRVAAREMYREALSYRPGDHLLLTKFLGLVTEEGDWSYSLDVVRRLIDTEQDPKVRSRYRHLGGMIARDELDHAGLAIEMLDQAVEDDPTAFQVADDLEALLAQQTDREPLVKFYYRRLEHVRADEGRPGERLRLWDKLGELLLELGHHEDALVAFEVALQLAPDDHARRVELADMYVDADPKHAQAAIATHQAVLRHDKRRLESYRALRTLYTRTKQPEKVAAVDEAIAFLQAASHEDKIEALFEGGRTGLASMRARPMPTRPLGNEDWLALARLDVDLQLSALFAVVAPPYAVERARMRPPVSVPAREHDVPAPIAQVIDHVVRVFQISRPPVYLDRDLGVACKVSMRTRDGALVPALMLGKPTIDKAMDERTLAFLLARQLADLRSERIARLLCPRAGELAQIIELASAQGDQQSHAAQWMTKSLHPVELEQARAIGARVRERGVQPMGAAVGWLTATERAADRIGYVVAADLATCCAALEDQDRVLELVWASVTEEVLGVRARIEAWQAAALAMP